jgi:hypothetical protein
VLKVSQSYLDARRAEILHAAVACFAREGLAPLRREHLFFLLSPYSEIQQKARPGISTQGK